MLGCRCRGVGGPVLRKFWGSDGAPDGTARGQLSPQGPGIWPGRGGAAGDHSQARADPRTRDSPGRWDARRWAEASGEGRHRSPRARRTGCSCSAKGWVRGERLGTNLLPPQELTGILPAEYPFRPGEKAPKVRRRIGAAYKLDEWALHREVRCCRAPSLLPEAGGCGPQALLPLRRGLCSSITQLRPLGSAWTRGTRQRVAHVASGKPCQCREGGDLKGGHGVQFPEGRRPAKSAAGPERQWPVWTGRSGSWGHPPLSQHGRRAVGWLGPSGPSPWCDGWLVCPALWGRREASTSVPPRLARGQAAGWVLGQLLGGLGPGHRRLLGVWAVPVSLTASSPRTH